MASTDDGWTWTPVPQVGDDVVIVEELPDGVVLAAESDRALWRSPDAGGSWGFVDVEEIHNGQGGDVEFLDFVPGADGSVLLATWNGIARSVDGGRTFRYYTTERPENTHAVSLAAGADGGTLAWLGTYGSGPILTDIDTHSGIDFPSLPVDFTRGSRFSPGWATNGIAVHDEGYSTWTTTDAGASWTLIASAPVVDGQFDTSDDVKGIAMAPDLAADPFLLVVAGERQMTFRYSEDLGTNWVDGVQDPVCTGRGFAVAVSPRWAEAPRAWAACGGMVYQSDDRARTWSSLGDTGTTFILGLAERADGVVLVATNDGLWTADRSGVARLAFDGDLVSAVDAAREAGDDTVFALVPRRGWFRSDDGGASWVDLPRPTDNLPLEVSLSERFAEDSTVAVGGYGGAWASRDGGASWFEILPEEVYNERSDAWTYAGPWRFEDAADASHGGVARTEVAGASAALDFRGIGVSLEVPVDVPPGGLYVTIDDGEPVLVSLPAADRIAWVSDSLAEGWHRLVIEAAAGVATVDAVHVKRLALAPRADVLDDAPAPTPRDCGCTGAGESGGTALAWGLVLACSMGRRARRRPGQHQRRMP